MARGDDTQQFDRLRDLFDRIVEIDPALREPAIRAECDGDAELERELRALFDADDRQQGRTREARECILDEGQEALTSTAALGERVGPWLLREVIGRGGMGVVYRAERAGGEVSQQVAVKVLQRWHVDNAGVRRFAQEREIIAQLTHPSIARLLDAGSTSDGAPYYAMELVTGEPIVDWCERRRASVAERLDTFLQVCDAVRHAHAHLVLHRDIKSENVLVDATGAVKLIDFGIAKTLNAIDATQAGLQFFSPSNAAPEQVRGERCGVACDVYQLGTLLYELLAGTTVLGEATHSPAEIEEAILHRVPRRPSEVVARRNPADAKGLRGDLDAIVMRALRKEPAQRYASVEQLADDVRRYRRHEAVAARGGERRYRIGRFLRRNRWPLAAGVSIGFLAVSIVAIQLVQSQRLQRERDVARVERNRAETAFTFLVDLFEGANPGVARARDLSAEEILQRGRDRLDAELADQPALRIPLMGTLATIYSALGDRESALRLVDDADRALAAGSVLDDRAHIAYLVRNARVRADADDFAGVERAAREALAIHERLGDPPGDSWEARSQLTEVALRNTDRSKWGALLDALVRELDLDSRTDPMVLARAKSYAGQKLAMIEDYDRSEGLLRHALATFESHEAGADEDALAARRALGTLLVADGRGGEGLPMLEQVLERQIELWGPNAAAAVRSRIGIGSALTRLRRYDEAEALLLHVEGSMKTMSEIQRPDVMSATIALGELYLETARPADAERRFREALDVSELMPGRDVATTIAIRTGLGTSLATRARWSDAIVVLAACEDDVSWITPVDARWAVTYAEVLHALGRDVEANAVLVRAQPLLDAMPQRLVAERGRGVALRRALQRPAS